MKTLRRFLALAAPFWLRQNPWYNWLLLAAVVGFSLAIVRVGVLITDWNKTFYDALAAFDGRAMPALILEYLVYITLVTAFVACGNWLRKVLLFRWREHLTGGEQQRISLTRALITRPDILFLDEATNQLDDDSATALLRLLKSELPDTLVIGISHQPPVKALFDRREDLAAFAEN